MLVAVPTAIAVPYPVADPAALPPDAPPAPPAPMKQNDGPCGAYGATEDFDPQTVPPAQQMLDLPQAWKTSRGAGVTVAVIDSGVTPQPRLPHLSGGGDYITPADNGLLDCDGHGSAIAGIIAAAPSDEDAFTGVAPEASIVSIRQTSEHYSLQHPVAVAGGDDPRTSKTAGTIATLARAIRHAADIPGVGIINLSLVACFPDYRPVDQAALGAALRYAAIDKNIVVIAAAGQRR